MSHLSNKLLLAYKKFYISYLPLTPSDIMKTDTVLDSQEHQRLLQVAQALMTKHKAFQEEQKALIKSMRDLLESRNLVFEYLRDKLVERSDTASLTTLNVIRRAQTFYEGVFTKEGVERHWEVIVLLVELLDPELTEEKKTELISQIEKIVFEVKPKTIQEVELLNPRFTFTLGSRLERK